MKCVSCAADWAAWRSVDNPRCSVKPCQVFIGASIEHELTFGLDHFVGGDHNWFIIATDEATDVARDRTCYW